MTIISYISWCSVSYTATLVMLRWGNKFNYSSLRVGILAGTIIHNVPYFLFTAAFVHLWAHSVGNECNLDEFDHFKVICCIKQFQRIRFVHSAIQDWFWTDFKMWLRTDYKESIQNSIIKYENMRFIFIICWFLSWHCMTTHNFLMVRQSISHDNVYALFSKTMYKSFFMWQCICPFWYDNV